VKYSEDPSYRIPKSVSQMITTLTRDDVKVKSVEDVLRMNIDYKIALLQFTIEDYYLGGIKSEINRDILKYFENVHFILKEPLGYIREVKAELSGGGKKRSGRKKNEATYQKPVNITVTSNLKLVNNNGPGPEPETVYAHTLLSQKVSSESGVTSRAERAYDIKILKPSEKIGWRNPTIEEFRGYNILIQLKIQESQKKFENLPIYGLVLTGNNSFRVVEHEAGKKKGSDKRLESRGVLCKGDSSKIIEYMKKVQLYPPDDVRKELLHGMTLYKMKGELESFSGAKKLNVNALSEPEIVFYWLWHKSGWATPDMCAYLREYLEQNNLILYW